MLTNKRNSLYLIKKYYNYTMAKCKNNGIRNDMSKLHLKFGIGKSHKIEKLTEN